MKTRKELKEEYRQSKPTMGVFKIENKTNGKLLIEASTNIPSLWNRYRMELKMGSCRNIALQDDWKEYGADNFVFEILSEMEHKDEADLDYNKELEILKDMVVDELKLDPGKKY